MSRAARVPEGEAVGQEGPPGEAVQGPGGLWFWAGESSSSLQPTPLPVPQSSKLRLARAKGPAPSAGLAVKAGAGRWRVHSRAWGSHELLFPRLGA